MIELGIAMESCQHSARSKTLRDLVGCCRGKAVTAKRRDSGNDRNIAGIRAGKSVGFLICDAWIDALLLVSPSTASNSSSRVGGKSFDLLDVRHRISKRRKRPYMGGLIRFRAGCKLGLRR